MSTQTLTNKTPQIDVSARALALARLADRLSPGSTYNIRLEKGNDPGSDWHVTVEGVITVREVKVYEPKSDNETKP